MQLTINLLMASRTIFISMRRPLSFFNLQILRTSQVIKSIISKEDISAFTLSSQFFSVDLVGSSGAENGRFECVLVTFLPALACCAFESG